MVMKNKLIIFLSVLLTFVSCEIDGTKLLDKDESVDMTEDKIFSDGLEANKWLMNCYSRMPKGFARFATNVTPVYLDCCSDDGQQGPTGRLTQALWFNNGTWDAMNVATELLSWNYTYTCVRPANKFLENVDRIPVNEQTSITEGVKTRMKGEATFLRALYYAELFKQVGGVAIITKQLKPGDPELYTPRSSVDETVDFICDELDKAAEVLPANYLYADPYNPTNPGAASPNEYGRATSMAAKAIKARVLLYAARPLFNDPRNPEGTVYRGAYDPDKWKKAAEAGADAIELAEANHYALYVHADDPKLSYEKFFVTRVNSEVILSYMRARNRDQETRQLPSRFIPSAAFPGVNLPTLGLVEAYEMKNGKAIDEEGSGYDPKNPYVGRDQRFYSSIIYNQAWYRQKYPAGKFQLQMWRSRDGITAGADYDASAMNTGFYLRKFCDEAINAAPAAGQTTEHNFPIIRYAEVLLNYAEAMNEAFGPYADGLGNGRTAAWALNQVRLRALQPEVANGLTKDQMREKIHNERRVELCFEEHRFYDVRHWMKGDTQKQIWVQDVFKEADGSFTYERRKVDRVFDAPKMYLLPIPFEQISNGGYEQNPGW